MATITGVVETADGELYANGRLEFKPVNTPVYTGGRLVLTAPIYVTTDANGAFSVVLRANRYEFNHRIASVPENKEGPIIIRVPNDTESYTINQLIESTMPLPDYFGGLPEATAGTGTVTSVTLVQPSAGFTITNSGTAITSTGTRTFALSDDLAALEALSGTDTIYYRSGANTWSAVTIGSNLTFSSGTLSATGGGSSNSFATIAVSGQSNVVADSSSDTLTLVAGSNVTITTDASTDTITISATGGGGGGSGDVVGPSSATDNAIARFDTTTGKLLQNSAATIADTTGDITAGKYNGVAISGSSTPTLAVTGTTAVSGTNTGDQDLSSYATTSSVTSAVSTHAALTATHGVSGAIVGTSDTQTLTNKRVTRRVSSVSYSASITPNGDTSDIVEIGALTGNLTLNAPSGTPTSGQELEIVITQDGTGGRTYTFDSAYQFSGDITTSILPTAANAKFRLVFKWSTVSTKWEVAGFAMAVGTSLANLSGDVTTSGLVATIANDAVTYAKMQNVSAASRLIGRGSASGSGDPEEITLGTGLSMSGTTLNSSAGVVNDPVLEIMQAMGSDIKAMTTGANPVTAQTAFTPTDARVQFSAVWLPEDATITGVSFLTRVQGNFTGDNNNKIGLYTYSGGTLTRVAQSANDENIWKAAAGAWTEVPFTSTYAATAGLYFVAALYNQSAQTTAPIISGMAAFSFAGSSSLDLTNSAKIACFLNSQTDLPTSQAMSGLTGISAAHPFFCLY